MELQIELGRLRPHDTRSSARAFIGMLIPQLAGKLFFPALVEDGLTDEEHLETAINIFLSGLRPEG
jgi:TetR/AcrR family transcriptional regulator